MEIERNVILITGGAGSFGSAFVKETLLHNPKAVRIVDNHEASLVAIHRELDDPRLRYMMCDMRDKDRLSQIMTGVDIVVHTAAMKHIDLCEYNPSETLKTNVVGSMNLVDVCVEKGVRKIIAISTDKAVRPISVYGATKLVMEKLFLDANSYTQSKFSCIRYGNFWESSNNVVTLWKQQKSEGKPITITDKDMSRYWINMDEAVDFAVQCIDWMQGGEIFIPMMPLHTLQELAQDLVPECKVNVIGARRGEKRREELYSEDEERYLERRKNCLVIKYR